MVSEGRAVLCLMEPDGVRSKLARAHSVGWTAFNGRTPVALHETARFGWLLLDRAKIAIDVFCTCFILDPFAAV